MRKDFITFGSPLIEQEDILAVTECLKSGWIGTGPKVAEFEKSFSKYVGSKYAIAVNSCTAALHLSLLAAGVGPGDEVITSAMTFCATVNAIIHTGATPVLVDCDPEFFCIDPQKVESVISNKTKAVLPVHFAGKMCDMGALQHIAAKYGLIIIEDCAHAIESTVDNKHAGTFSTAGCFSFYVTKNLTTAEGGMVVCDDTRLADKVKMKALHGLSADAWARYSDSGFKHYHVQDIGFKYNMTDIQAAMGIKQLARINQNWMRRTEIWNIYLDQFADLPLRLPGNCDINETHAFHLFTVLVEESKAGISRDDLIDMLFKRNIGTGVHYLSIPSHPYYQRMYGWNPRDYPVSLSVGSQTLSLPLSPKLSSIDVERVVSTLRDIF